MRKEININVIGAWPFFSRATVICIFALLILCIGFLVDTKKMLMARRQVVRQYKLIKREYTQTVFKCKKLTWAMRQLNATNKVDEKYKIYLSQPLNISKLLDNFSYFSDNKGIILTSVKPLSKTVVQQKIIYPIQTTGVANYSQITSFTAALIKLPWFLLVKNLLIEPTGKTTSNKEKLSFTMLLLVYHGVVKQ